LAATSELEIFSTCPQSRGADRASYLADVAAAARWSEQAGHRGTLVYSDNGLVDAWLVSQAIIESTTELCPLVAVQPVYTHPYTVAKLVTSLAYLYGRRVYLNMLAGGFKNDLVALGDETPHDERYARTTEFTLIVKGLLAGEAVTLEGSYYQVRNLSLAPPVPPELMPGFLVSGSSEAGFATARAIGATAVKYPKPAGEEEPPQPSEEGVPLGARFGIVARPRSGDAWRVARERFPEDRKGRVTHRLAMKVSDSQWHSQLSDVSGTLAADDEENPYWLVPFEQYQTFCPYLVGSYERVGAEVARYLRLGFTTFVLDIPPSEDELQHTAVAFEQAVARRA
jgi:alkanesulfonate monooxygenase